VTPNIASVCIVDDGWTPNLKFDDNVTTPQTTAIAHSLYNCNNMQQLTRFYHACLILLVISTLTNAINIGYLKGFPDLTAQRICQHVQINNATKRGHMDQTRQGQRSTQPNLTNTSNANNLLETTMPFLTTLMRARPILSLWSSTTSLD
jgi:hypothetical protein